MRLSKLIVVFLPVIFLLSCTDPEEFEKENTYVGTITMNGAQETPPVTTSATGTIEATYSKLSKTLSYKVTFSGLSGNATAAHIHGPGEVGIKADVLQTFTFPAKTSGTYSGTLFIDGVKIKEEELIAGRYYINIHTAANPAGEIRGQLALAKK
jgi:hypothetical protein